MQPCPDDETLRLYLDAVLTPEAEEPLSLHVEGCATCQGRLDRLSSPPQTVNADQ